MEEVPGSAKFFPAQLVLLALGFLGPENTVIKALNVKQDGRSNIQTASKVSFINGEAVGRIANQNYPYPHLEILDECRRCLRCW
jgi:NADPH-dependent glutamate synthase beta subunit-like oxidoreductase